MQKLSAAAFFLAMATLLTSTGCLKTRAQLREEDAEPSAAPRLVPAQIESVQPQGQYVIDELKAEMIRLNGRIEDLERSQKQLDEQGAQSSRQEMQKLEHRIVELETAQKEMLEVIKQAQTAAANPDDVYAQGKQHYDAGDFESAIESFNAYLKNPKNKRVEEATFFRGESYFNLKQYKKAIVDYSKFPERFSKSSRMPQVLLKTGMAFEALGLKDDAKGFYQELIEKYPKSQEAKRARGKVK